MKNKAFTLAEILITMTIVGIVASVMIQVFKPSTYDDKANVALAYKAISVFDEASVSLTGDSVNCPVGALLYKTGKNDDGTYDYEMGLALPNSNKEQAVLDIYGNYIKYEETGLDFCANSLYCEKKNKDIELEESKLKNIPAVKFSGSIYAGLRLNSTISDCPDFYLPESDTKLTVKSKIKGGKPKCWATLLIDVNGKKGPNEEGRDVFIFGMDESGIYH